MGQEESKDPLDVDAIWKAEAKLSLVERRKRYKCRNKFITVDKIPKWESNDKSIANAEKLRVDDAREDERYKRNLERKAKEKQMKTELKSKEIPKESTEIVSPVEEKKEEKMKEEQEIKVEKKEEKKEEEKEEKKEETKQEKEDKKEEKGEKQSLKEAISSAPLNDEALKAKMKQKRKERKIMELEEEKRSHEERDIPLGTFSYSESINKKVALIQEDITSLEIDAIVNAANRSLLGGGGIDGAIHSAAGKKLLSECKTLKGAATGETKVTRGYNLPAKFVLHTVGPVGRHQEELIQAYSTCLEQVGQHKIKTVAFCGISSGIYGYPLFAASHIALHTIRKWLEVKENRKKVDLIIFCTYLPKELACYQKLMPLYFPPKDQDTDSVVKLLKEPYNKYDPTHDEILEKEEKEERVERKRMEERKKKIEEENRKREKKKEDKSESKPKEEDLEKKQVMAEEKKEAIAEEKKQEEKNEVIAEEKKQVISEEKKQE